jgi:hypothetical protein
VKVREITMRRALALSCLLAVSVAAGAEPAKDAKQFIDRTNIVFPKAMGAYEVDSHEQDPEVMGGVMLGFDEPEGMPENFTVTAYVYPMGPMDAKAALDAGIGHILAGVRGRPDYTDIRFEPATDFAVPAPAAPSMALGLRGHKKVISSSGLPPEKPDATDEDLTAARIAWTSPELTTGGRRVVMHYLLDGLLVRSVGYVFYRQMMLVKLRVTSSVLSVDESNFLALADKAALAIAPSFEIQNFGRCGVHYIPSTPDGQEDRSGGNAGGYALMKELGRVQRQNCALVEGKPDTLPAGMLRHTLVYPPDTWQ